jgi:hypothetical protein
MWTEMFPFPTSYNVAVCQFDFVSIRYSNCFSPRIKRWEWDGDRSLPSNPYYEVNNVWICTSTSSYFWYLTKNKDNFNWILKKSGCYSGTWNSCCKKLHLWWHVDEMTYWWLRWWCTDIVMISKLLLWRFSFQFPWYVAIERVECRYILEQCVSARVPQKNWNNEWNFEIPQTVSNNPLNIAWIFVRAIGNTAVLSVIWYFLFKKFRQ